MRMGPDGRKVIFQAVKAIRKGQPYTEPEVRLLDAAIDQAMLTASRPVPLPATPPRPVPPVPLPTPPLAPGKFALGEKSRERLKTLHPQLRVCVELAITLTTVDFIVLQTSRTLAEQRKAFNSGNSRTMASKHLPQRDGFAHAVDLAVWKNGKVSWDFEGYYAIAFAMDQAATRLGIARHVRWGCAWDRVLSDFGGELEAYVKEVAAYKKRHRGSDFLDGPHFEWVP